MRLIGPNGSVEVTVPEDTSLQHTENTATVLTIGSETYSISYLRDGASLWVARNGYSARFTLPYTSSETFEKEIRAPMTGKLLSLRVKPGSHVKEGDVVLILEAMKMEHRIEARVEGTVQEVGAEEGDLVDLGQLLVILA